MTAVYGEYVETHGYPPNHFVETPAPLSVLPLPVMTKETEFYQLLAKRKTTRVFDTQTPLTQAELSLILYYVYGCHGYAPVFPPNLVGLRKTSPSGGGLHPVEVYPLVINVADVDPGVYHYNVRDHSLELVREATRKQAAALANEFTAGQGYPRWAHALFVMTARFYRNFWKYRRHGKTYSVLFMDAAHLSQTFYLVCADLGLGAFVTAAINNTNIEERLGIDGVDEGALAICGCGKPQQRDYLDPTFLPYVARQTSI